MIVLAIGTGESQSSCQDWINTYNLTHPVLSDVYNTTHNLFASPGNPFLALVNYDKTLLWSDDSTTLLQMRTRLDNQISENPRFNGEQVLDSEQTTGTYPIEIEVVSIDELQLDSMKLYWSKTGGSPFSEIPLTLSAGKINEGTFIGFIPAQPWGSTISYFVEGSDQEGRQNSSPDNAPLELFDFYVGPDLIKPVIEHEKPGTDNGSFPIENWPPLISALVTDNLNTGLSSVWLEYRINHGLTGEIEMTLQAEDLYGVIFPVQVQPGTTVMYRIKAIDTAQAANTAFLPDSEWFELNIVDKIPVYLFDPDPNQSTGMILKDLLDNRGIDCVHENTLLSAENLQVYKSIFVCLGIYPNNYILTPEQGSVLAQYLDAGGNLYMEGGDTWYYDPATPVHSYFHLNALSDGGSISGQIEGVPGTWTAGFVAAYSGKNGYIDELAPQAGASSILKARQSQANLAIIYDSGTYKTIASSIEFCGLINVRTPVQDEYLEGILQFFNIEYVQQTPTVAPLGLVALILILSFFIRPFTVKR